MAKRPLTLAEVHSLYRVDLQKKSLLDRKSDMREVVTSAGGLLIYTQDGLIAYRHNSISAYLSQMMAERTYILGQMRRRI